MYTLYPLSTFFGPHIHSPRQMELVAASSHRGKTIKSYTMEFKLRVVEYAVLHGNHKASKEFQVDRKRIRDWRQNEPALRANLSLNPTRRKSIGGQGRPLEYPEIDLRLYSWVQEHRENGYKLTGAQIRKEARRLHQIDGKETFKGSVGWYQRFMKRFHLD